MWLASVKECQMWSRRTSWWSPGRTGLSVFYWRRFHTTDLSIFYSGFMSFYIRGPSSLTFTPGDPVLHKHFTFYAGFYLLHCRGPSWHSDHLSLSVHPLLNTVFFKLVFFFLTTALIFLVTVAVAIIIIKLTEIIGWLVEVRKSCFSSSLIASWSRSAKQRKERAFFEDRGGGQKGILK